VAKKKKSFITTAPEQPEVASEPGREDQEEVGGGWPHAASLPVLRSRISIRPVFRFPIRVQVRHADSDGVRLQQRRRRRHRTADESRIVLSPLAGQVLEGLQGPMLQNFLRPKFTDFQSKQECLSVLGLSSLVLCFGVSLGSATLTHLSGDPG
jgi:hypothetical protein